MSYDMLYNSLSLEQLLLHLVLNLVNIKFLHGLFLMLMYPFYVCWYSTIGYLASSPVMNGYGFAYPSCLMILSNFMVSAVFVYMMLHKTYNSLTLHDVLRNIGSSNGFSLCKA